MQQSPKPALFSPSPHRSAVKSLRRVGPVWMGVSLAGLLLLVALAALPLVSDPAGGEAAPPFWHAALSAASLTAGEPVTETLFSLFLPLVEMLETPEPTSTPTPTATQTTPAGFWYTVLPGDTLSSIAARFNTTVAAIMAANQITNPNLIRVGQQLWIPAPAPAGSTATPTATATATPSSSATPTHTPTTGAPSGGFWYTVRPGDTLASIAARFNTSVTAIMAANQITNPNLIRVGQQLWIPQTSSSTPWQLAYGFNISPWGADLEELAAVTAAAGFGWVKFQLAWDDVEHDAKGRYNWSGVDPVMDAFHGAGIQILISVAKAPSWARAAGTNFDVHGPPARSQDFADFVGALVARYAQQLDALELWNEQNLWYEWGGEPLDAARYVELLCRGYEAAKAHKPLVQVISGGLTPTGVNDGVIAVDDLVYLRRMLQGGAGGCFDGLGAHPSGYNNPPTARYGYTDPAEPEFKNHPSFFFQETLQRYRELMAEFGQLHKPIWVTEFGWASSTTPAPGYEYAADVSEAEQAGYLVQAYGLMRQWGWVEMAQVWNLNFSQGHPQSEMAHFSVWGRPAYDALAAMEK